MEKKYFLEYVIAGFLIFSWLGFQAVMWTKKANKEAFELKELLMYEQQSREIFSEIEIIKRRAEEAVEKKPAAKEILDVAKEILYLTRKLNLQSNKITDSIYVKELCEIEPWKANKWNYTKAKEWKRTKDKNRELSVLAFQKKLKVFEVECQKSYANLSKIAVDLSEEHIKKVPNFKAKQMAILADFLIKFPFLEKKFSFLEKENFWEKETKCYTMPHKKALLLSFQCEW